MGVTKQRSLAPETVFCVLFFFHNKLCRQVTVFGRGPIKYVLLVVGAKYLLSGIALETTFKSCPPTRHTSTGRKTCQRLANAPGPRKRAVIEGIARRKHRIPYKGLSHRDRSVWVWKVRPLQQQDERGSSQVFDVLL